VYAGTHDSYYAFKALFDPIIEAYHGHKPDSKHISNMDSSKLNCPPLLNEDNKGMILSTRIRVGRNLDGFPLGPGLTR
jgi:arginine kinase